MALTLDPKRCAVMAMDYQNEILGMTPNYREKNLLGTVKRVLDAARHTSAAIVYITVSFRDDYADAPAHSPLFQDEKARGVMKAGSPGAAICDELTPVLRKNSILIALDSASPGFDYRSSVAMSDRHGEGRSREAISTGPGLDGHASLPWKAD